MFLICPPCDSTNTDGNTQTPPNTALYLNANILSATDSNGLTNGQKCPQFDAQQLFVTIGSDPSAHDITTTLPLPLDLCGLNIGTITKNQTSESTTLVFRRVVIDCGGNAEDSYSVPVELLDGIVVSVNGNACN